jgi:sugar transferase (PEP-CTERM/EpsH1 system associated)
MNKPPLVVHLVYCFNFGGLETLVAECVNRMPADRYRHAIVCLTDANPAFAKAITRPSVDIIALHKPPGLGLATHLTFWKLMRRLKPAILHTYNLAAAEYAATATLAGVPVRIHAEHGREASDPDGKNRKHNLLRRLLLPFIDCYVAVSADLQRWLKEMVGIPDAKNLLIHNGVDTAKFQPALQPGSVPSGWPFSPEHIVIGTVGRIQDVKNHRSLVDAFVQLQALLPQEKHRLRLAIVGDGPLLPALREQVKAAGIANDVWLPGARTDIAQLMQAYSVFALPSIAEGTPVTILEAMASGLPVVATRVGGIPEVVADGVTGKLVAPADTATLATALAEYCRQPELAAHHGAAGRERVERRNSIAAMVAAYAQLYEALSKDKTNFRGAITSCAE